MKTSLITGSNRGIGLELCRQLLARGERVIATCRSSSPDLDGLAAANPGQLVIEIGIDVTSDASVQALAERVADLDLVVLNAGIMLAGDRPGQPNFDNIKTQFEVNTLGALRVAVALVPRLSPHARIAFVSSRMGSIADNSSGSYYGYRMSKAAENMAAVSLARDLAPKGIAVAVLHPGMVKTDMTRGHGQVEPADAVRGLLARIDALTVASSGGFWHANGDVLPW